MIKQQFPLDFSNINGTHHMLVFKSFWAMADNLLLAEDLELGVLLGAHGHLDHCGLEVGWEDGGHLDVL